MQGDTNDYKIFHVCYLFFHLWYIYLFSSLMNIISSSEEESCCFCLGFQLISGGFKSGSSSDAKTKSSNIS